MKILTKITTLAVGILCALPAQAGTIDKDTALLKALKNNPSVLIGLADVSKAKGRHIQAGLVPNPEAVFEIENFAGDEDFSGFDATETTIGLEQKIEMGGKRQKRQAVTEQSYQIAYQNALAQTVGLLAETDIYFTRVAVAQERLKLAEKRLSLADKTHTTVKERVSAAAASDIQHTKVDIEQSAAKLAKTRAEVVLAEAQSQLAKLIADENIDDVDTTLNDIPDVPDRTKLLTAIENLPQVRAFAIASAQSQSELDLVKAEAIPDPTIGLGVRRFNETDSTALVAGISFPIPVFNRNQGAIYEANANVASMEAQSKLQDLSLRQSAVSAWDKLSLAHDEVTAYQNDIIPSAQRAYDQASKGYSAGRFSFLDLLDSQRTLYQVQSAYLDSILILHEAKSEIDVLMGAYERIIMDHLSSTQGNIK